MTGFDFSRSTLEDIDQYVMGKLVWHDQTLSHILIGHLMIEGLVEALIASRLPYPDRLFSTRNLSFEAKLNLASSMDALTDGHAAAAKALNKLRNRYAHDRNFEISLGDLSPFQFGWSSDQKKAFKLAGTKGVGEALQIALIFLSFSFQALLHVQKGPDTHT